MKENEFGNPARENVYIILSNVLQCGNIDLYVFPNPDPVIIVQIHILFLCVWRFSMHSYAWNERMKARL